MSSQRARRPASTTRIEVQRLNGSQRLESSDWVATEEPLEIRLVHQDRGGPLQTSTISVTMRTPGHDFELAAGFLFTEGILSAPADLEGLAYCVEEGADQLYNLVNVQLRAGVRFDPARLTRHFYTTSSCGVCGKASLEALAWQGCTPLPDGPAVPAALIRRLPARLRGAQALFARTGGLHAAGLFDLDGTLRCLREDVGRHNALDKVIGHSLMHHKLPLSATVLVLSGRASFELAQKALMAGIPIVAAVGAPSSLAVRVARQFNLTLLGFVGEERFNLYSGAARLVTGAPRPGERA